MAKNSPSTSTSSAALKAHRARLAELHRATKDRLEKAAAEYEVLRDEGGDVGAGEDEGGGEADVTTAERDRLHASISVETEALEAIEAALERAQGPDWNRCSSCGGPIGEARLEAIASTDRCVTCKAASTSW